MVPGPWVGVAADLLRVVSLVVIGYYLLVTLNYLVLYAVSLVWLRRTRRGGTGEAVFTGFSAPSQPGVAVVVPAYNEAETIVDSVGSFLGLDYPDLEVIVVNDGSTDETLDRLQAGFDLVPAARGVAADLPTEPVRGVFRSETHEELLVVDKENGGKSDALNAGIWLTDQPLFCAVDSDTIIERWGLSALVQPFLDHPDETVAAGGTVRVANGCEFDGGRLADVDLSRRPLVAVQAVEYLRAFYVGRLGLARLRSLILISGAFGLFRTDLVRDIGGYRRESITEDFDLVVRLHRHCVEAGRDYRVEFVPEAGAWTEAPSTRAALGRQRRRWFRGRVEILATNWRAIGNPRYGVVGLYSLPYFLVVETLGPLVEGAGYLLVPLAVALGVLSPVHLGVFFLLTVGVGIVLSTLALYAERLSPAGYDEPRHFATLFRYGVLENLGYRQWLTLVAWHGLVEYLRGETAWGEMERAGFEAD